MTRYVIIIKTIRLERVAVSTNYCYIGNNKMHPGETITLVAVNKTVIKDNWNIVPYTLELKSMLKSLKQLVHLQLV